MLALGVVAVLAVVGVAVVGSVSVDRGHDPDTALARAGGTLHPEVAGATTPSTDLSDGAPSGAAIPPSPPATGAAGTGQPDTPPTASAPAADGPSPAQLRGLEPSLYANPTPAQLLTGAQSLLPSGWTAAVHSMVIDGLTRQYLVVQPAGLAGPAPVVVLLHGRGQTADEILHLTGLVGRVGPAVIVVPQGWDRSWDAGHCCGRAWRSGVDDVEFVQTALHQVLASTPAADPGQVYAVGFSNGGRLAFRLACGLPGVFEGIVAAEAVPVDHCPATRPLDVAVIAQDDDPLLALGPGLLRLHIDGYAEPTVAATVQTWRRLDGCGAGTVAQQGVATVRTWSCAAGTSLEYIRYPSGGHTWRPASGATPGATDVVVDMLRSHLHLTL